MDRESLAKLKLNLLWAKTPHNDSSSYLPLLAHLLDTAAVAKTILEREPFATLELYARDFGVEPQVALNLVASLCGLHDLGKASPVFQAKWKEGRRHLEGEGFPFPPGRFLDGPHHGAFSWVFLEELLRENGFPENLVRGLALALSSHHGFPPDPNDLNKIRQSPRRRGPGPWEDARRELFGTMFRALGNKEMCPQRLSPEGAALLMGLASVADWIASNESFFPYTRPLEDPGTFFIEALSLAQRALDQLGWNVEPIAGEVPAFKELFTFDPNPLQDTVAGVCRELKEPSFLLIEAPMGGGKTEAAFYAHLFHADRFGHRGLYLALPTQATGNGMFLRVRHFLESLSICKPIELQLQHGTALLNREYLELRAVGEEELEGVRASEWFSPRKRAMLAPYGVGTVDQALLSVLRVRHHFVRLLGLANRTVVLDEIHAYDAYTSALLEVLVRWLRRLGASVIVMSATLSKNQRRHLLEAAGGSLSDEAQYPRVTSVSRNGTESRSIPWPKRKVVKIAEAPILPKDLADFLRDLTAKGGVAGTVVNTVNRAQALYRSLGEGTLLRDERGFTIGKHLPNGLEVYLFHARFPSEERTAREQAVIARFGKSGQRPERAILVATQVVEQSLDLDFDVLVSDLAPVDLLLQRSGRLHRHTRPRPALHQKPCLFVSGLSRDPPQLSEEGWGSVYYPYLLLATWWHLSNRKNLCLPQDLETLVSLVYDEDLPAGLPEDLIPVFGKAKSKMIEKIEENRGRALRACLNKPEALLDLQADYLGHFRLEDEEETPYINLALTRLGEPSVQAVPVFDLEDDLYFDPQGREPVPLRKRLDLEEAFKVFQRSVRLSHRSLVNALLKESSPWERSPLVSRARLLRLSHCGETSFGRLRVCLSEELGIVYEKEEI